MIKKNYEISFSKRDFYGFPIAFSNDPSHFERFFCTVNSADDSKYEFASK